MTTLVTGDAKLARELHRKRLLEQLLVFGGDDLEALRDIIRDLVEELPTPSLEMAVEQITAKQEAFGETVIADKPE